MSRGCMEESRHWDSGSNQRWQDRGVNWALYNDNQPPTPLCDPEQPMAAQRYWSGSPCPAMYYLSNQPPLQQLYHDNPHQQTLHPQAEDGAGEYPGQAESY